MPDPGTIQVIERIESRRVNVSSQPSAELRYSVIGARTEQEAHEAVAQQSPSLYNVDSGSLLLIPRSRIRVEPIADELWDATVQYAPSRFSTPIGPTGPSAGVPRFSFETGGGTQHITHSLETVVMAGSNIPNYERAINVNRDLEIEGVDIVVPNYQFAETHFFQDASVTQQYKIALLELTGTVNDSPFRGFEAGEVLFLGASGQRNGVGLWEINFRFAVSRNKTGLTIGSGLTAITVDKKGWEYLWIKWDPIVDESVNRVTVLPTAVYVEKVYEESDFSRLGIGT